MRQNTVLGLLEDLTTGSSVLDVGCGNARDLELLVTRGYECVGLDASLSMITEGKKKLAELDMVDVDFVLASATNMPFKSESFDGILCSETLEHIPSYASAIGECYRLIRETGIVVITTPNRVSLYGFFRMISRLLGRPSPHPFDEWKSEGELAMALRAAGLKVAENWGFCFLPGQLSYLLPDNAKVLLVKLTTLIEPLLASRLRQLGYGIAVKCQR